ncbi:MAG: L-lactate dehydrogenase [Clostridia bacterium]|nr:L-lactate dehydrogenase [Clostridia bacterium]
MYRGKVCVIGSGFVGSSIAYTLFIRGLFSEIAIIDINRDKADGDAQDMNHGVPFVTPCEVRAADYDSCADADMVIITAGANQKVGETRTDLLRRNVEVFRSIIENVTKHAKKEPIMLVVTNPVDVLTYVTYRLTGYQKHKIIGSGTVLDTARLKSLISRHVNIDARNVHTFIVGEHGDTEFPAWSVTNIAGLTMPEYCDACGKCNRGEIYSLAETVKSAAYDIIKKKGATYYAIALSVARIAEAIVNDENSILTVSGVLYGEYNLKDVSLSVPMVVGEGGIQRIVEIPFNKEEMSALAKSAETIRASLKEVGF